MALLQFDSKRCEVTVRVGVLEEYKPDKEIKRIHKKAKALRTEAEEKLSELTETKDGKEALKVLKENEETARQWREYLEGPFNSELREIIGSIKKKNEKICPGFKEELG